MLAVNNAVNARCPVKNLAVKNYLLANPDIKTVVIVAYWSTYFREDGPLTVQAGNERSKDSDIAKTALASTIQWLRSNNRQVVLIGPVPVYESSVPLVLALEKATGSKFLSSSMEKQRKKHASFFDVVNEAKRGSEEASFRFLDPIQWLCADDCKVMKDGTPLYRDSHHLSVAGAMALEPDLRHGLAAASTVLNNASQFSTTPQLVVSPNKNTL